MVYLELLNINSCIKGTQTSLIGLPEQQFFHVKSLRENISIHVSCSGIKQNQKKDSEEYFPKKYYMHI